jgi:hypothetical protein
LTGVYRLAALALAGLAAGAAYGSSVRASPLTFVAYGDMPYSPGEIPVVERLVDSINALQPAVTIHIGDTKSGSSPCTDAALARPLDEFQRFAGALVYTPGDNEWTDCRRSKAGGYDPAERLARLRQIYFAEASSQGQRPIALTRQSEGGGRFAAFSENARWSMGDVTFATINATGSNNNRGFDKAGDQEYAARNAADLAWLAAALDEARRRKARAIVIAMQADPHFERPQGPTSGYRDLVFALADLALSWRRPLLIVHGDSHTYRFDQPLRGRDGAIVATAYRLEVPGSPFIGAVAVDLDTAGPTPFRVRLLTPPNSG